MPGRISRDTALRGMAQGIDLLLSMKYDDEWVTGDFHGIFPRC